MVTETFAFISNMFIALTTPKLVLFCIFVFVMVVTYIVYKLASNHIHHVELSIIAQTSAMTSASDKLVQAIESFKDTSTEQHMMQTEQHMKQVEVLNQILGRTDKI